MNTRERRLRIWETDYGQECGWTIELNGIEVGVLIDPRYEDMFWVSYKIEVTTDDHELAGRMNTKEFWNRAETDGIEWRNREFGEVAEHSHPSIKPFPEPGRLTMRGLRLAQRGPDVFERVILWWRKRKRKRSVTG